MNSEELKKDILLKIKQYYESKWENKKCNN